MLGGQVLTQASFDLVVHLLLSKSFDPCWPIVEKRL